MSLPLCALALLLTGGCKSTYYSTMEKFGVEKRDILVDRVEEARDAQEDTKEQFADALEEFSALVEFDGGELEKMYDRLKDEFESSERVAAKVRDRINAVEDVGEDLFREWEAELAQFSNPKLRRDSELQLRQTRERFDDMVATMRRAEAKMDPVLVAFRDQVLYLKHNLNAQAIASLDQEALRIQEDVKTLIEDMEASIAEANAFIDSMQKGR